MNAVVKRSAVGAIVAFGLASHAVIADEAVGTMTVQVNVQDVCAVGGSSLDFGTYTPGQQEDLLGQGSISYAGCAPGTLTIELDGGSASDVANRRLGTGGGSSLSYQLYLDPARSTLWGEGLNAQQVQLILGGSGSVPVYGRIPASQTADSGTYTDSINITVTF